MKIFNRRNREYFEEKVYGDFFVRLTYGNALGHGFVSHRHSQKLWSRMIGWFQNRPRSARNIESFVKNFSIDMSEFIEPEGGFDSFNDFFIRRLKAGKRNFPTALTEMGSLAEGRLSVFKIKSAGSLLSVKGEIMSVEKLLDSKELAQKFVDGYSFVFRLCPVDYHRFHFPDDGIPTHSQRVGRNLHSVNPLAQQKIPDVFVTNERQISLLESKNFGTVGIVEVGALGVGKIHQTYTPDAWVGRGDEKGYFSFGGSTVIMLSQRDRFAPDADLLEKSEMGIESLVRLGEVIGRS